MNEIKTVAETYIRIRRSLGFKMKREEKLLSQFIKFLEMQGSAYITSSAALSWAVQPRDCHPGNWRNRLFAIRRFAKYLYALDPRTEIPPRDLLNDRYQRRTPHIYTGEEILRLIRVAKRTRALKGLWGWTFSTVFGLLAVTGMRIAEVVNLNREDVDLNEGILTIRETKFRKSRLVPIHPSTTKVLKRYARSRDRVFPKLQSDSFFVTEWGRWLRAKKVGEKFRALARKIDLRGPKGTPGPHLHDLRHTFAVNTMLIWYRSGVDVEAHMPELSTYLGHLSTAETYWYLSAVPELLFLAAKKLEHT
jgi:integrase/recombinase XerD